MTPPLEIIKKYLKHEKYEIFREVIFSIIISSIVTFLFTSYHDQINDRRIASREFIYEFSRTFFDNQKYRNLSIALENNYLYGDTIKVINKNEFMIGNITFSEYDLDDYLGLLGDIYSFYKECFITKELLNQQYSYYICIAYKNSEIKSYRVKLSEDGFSNQIAYSFLDEFAKELKLDDKDCRNL